MRTKYRLFVEVSVDADIDPPTCGDMAHAVRQLLEDDERNLRPRVVEIETEFPKGRRPQPSVRQTTCRRCELDIEGVRPFKRGTWRDRGGETHCPHPVDGRRPLHAPVLPL